MNHKILVETGLRKLVDLHMNHKTLVETGQLTNERQTNLLFDLRISTKNQGLAIIPVICFVLIFSCFSL